MTTRTQTSQPHSVLVTNGTYRCLLSPAGTGFSSFGERQLTGWDADPCEDDQGLTIYVRDLKSGAIATASGIVAAGQEPGSWETTPTAAVLHRDAGGIASTLRLEVLADAPVERRVLELENPTGEPRELELTAYVEVVLNDPAAHAGHPGFSKLFIETHWSQPDALLFASRRPRANGEQHPLLALALAGAPVLEWETDRSRFLGRGRRVRQPVVMQARQPLSGRVGAVLDPVLALRTRVTVPPHSTVEVRFILAVADDLAALRARIAHGAGASALAPALDLDGDLLKPLAPALAQLYSGYLRGGGLTVPSTTMASAAASTAEEGGGRAVTAPLQAANGHGGFSADGREYVVRVARHPDGTLALPPMPWSNVLANEHFGAVVTEKGSISTWSRNSRLYRLTPWRNDALADPHDEAFYVRDEDSGAFWSVLPGPAPRAQAYEVRHGFGYSRWQHRSGGLEHAATVYVGDEDAVRVLDVTISNPSEQTRHLSFYAFNRWVLGASSAETGDSVEVEYDPARGAVLARNPDAGVFAGGIAFAALAGVDGLPLEACVDRAAFLGVPGFMATPHAVAGGAALKPVRGSQPAAALRVRVSLAAGARIRCQALLGEAGTTAELDRLLRAYRAPNGSELALRRVADAWSERLGWTQIETPEPAIDLMVNGWLVYQTIVCRLWARTAFYQSGGAYGFRDQLQDAAALAHSHPQILRQQLLNNAAHQFSEGDVLHWWHPPRGDGIRTRFADDLVWLPYLTARYVAATGDAAVLAESIGFRRGPELDAGEDERFVIPEDAGVAADLYEHCVRAFKRAMTAGAHGLPLFGCGDWNDGMNRVGREGRGESVWMAFFLYAAIGDFLPLCELRGDEATRAELLTYQRGLSAALEQSGWDGAWYRRGYYDNGAPLGSTLSDECQIDALVQAWAVISKAAPAARADAALDAAERRLVSDDDGLIRLLTPPFVATAQDPGYIKGYLAGVRENGGQYTHAALWLVKAFAEAGRRNRAAELLTMLSPVTRGGDARRIAVYQVEPYVIAADVYGVPPHVGRGGWTWYTGSSGWMYRVALESILGFTIEGGTTIRLNPCIPDHWQGFVLTHRRRDGTSFRISVENPNAASARIVGATLDGKVQPVGTDGVRVPIATDGAKHEVRIVLGPHGAGA